MPQTRSQRTMSRNANIHTSANDFNNITKSTMNKIKAITLTPVGGFIALVFTTVFIHWALVNLYISLCAPPTIMGLMTTMISLGSPVCYFINVTQVELAKHYISIWGSAGIAMITWIAAKFSVAKKS